MVDKKRLGIKLFGGDWESLNFIDSFSTYLLGICFVQGTWLNATATRMTKTKLHEVGYSLVGKEDIK